MSIQTYVFMDLETTGLPMYENNMTRITEISMVAVKRTHLLDTRPGAIPRVRQKLTLCFNPGRIIDQDCTEVTGLDNFLLEYEPVFNKKAFSMIDSFLSLLTPPLCLVAQNGLNFDYPILKNYLVRLKVNFTAEVLCADCYHGFYHILEKIKKEREIALKGKEENEQEIPLIKKTVVSDEKNKDMTDYDTPITMQAANNTTPTLLQAANETLPKSMQAANETLTSMRAANEITPKPMQPANETLISMQAANETTPKPMQPANKTLISMQAANETTPKPMQPANKTLISMQAANETTPKPMQPANETVISMKAANETTPKSVQPANETTPKSQRVIRPPVRPHKSRRNLFPWGDSPRPTDSYRLKDIYSRVLNKPAIDAHHAENDCIFALEIAAALSKQFVEWVDINHRNFDDIQSM